MLRSVQRADEPQLLPLNTLVGIPSPSLAPVLHPDDPQICNAIPGPETDFLSTRVVFKLAITSPCFMRRHRAGAWNPRKLVPVPKGPGTSCERHSLDGPQFTGKYVTSCTLTDCITCDGTSPVKRLLLKRKSFHAEK